MCITSEHGPGCQSNGVRPVFLRQQALVVSSTVTIAQIGQAVNGEFYLPGNGENPPMKVQKIPAAIGQIGYVRIEEKGHVTGWATRCPRGDNEVKNFNLELNQVAAFLLETFASEIVELELWLEEIRKPGTVTYDDARKEWLTFNGEVWADENDIVCDPPKDWRADLQTGSSTGNVRNGVLHRLAKWLKNWRSSNAR